MKLVRLSLLALVLVTPLTASASACVFNGKSYPPGSVIGDRVCQADGTWRAQNRSQQTAATPAKAQGRTTRP